MKGYLKLRRTVLYKLKSDLPSYLSYHGLDHTLDVLNVCEQYIRRLKLSEEQRYLLRVGAIVHDMGFLKGPANHEEVGSAMAADIMRDLGINEKLIQEVKGLVMATKIPQTPLNPLQMIICDADLDYLGRSDYPEISQKLFEELKYMKVIETEEQWKNLQINFLKAHHFHTPFAVKNREPKKQVWLNKLLNS
ncbi:HD domain-containing protein [Algoriphagus sp. SE2]|uniref:HD domain-containing protein n=1 Tax=Algoriphagus sp. SE2 TaxID=3141536 RepID=UPI0031CD5D5C